VAGIPEFVTSARTMPLLHSMYAALVSQPLSDDFPNELQAFNYAYAIRLDLDGRPNIQNWAFEVPENYHFHVGRLSAYWNENSNLKIELLDPQSTRTMQNEPVAVEILATPGPQTSAPGRASRLLYSVRYNYLFQKAKDILVRVSNQSGDRATYCDLMITGIMIPVYQVET
jgi:hypothetical protein